MTGTRREPIIAATSAIAEEDRHASRTSTMRADSSISEPTRIAEMPAVSWQTTESPSASCRASRTSAHTKCTTGPGTSTSRDSLLKSAVSGEMITISFTPCNAAANLESNSATAPSPTITAHPCGISAGAAPSTGVVRADCQSRPQSPAVMRSAMLRLSTFPEAFKGSCSKRKNRCGTLYAERHLRHNAVSSCGVAAPPCRRTTAAV